MTYLEALDYIAALEARGWRLGLDRMEEFTRRAGLTDALGGTDMAYKVAGGNKWWQVRAGSLEGEWILMKKDFKDLRASAEEKWREERGNKVEEQ